MKSCLVFFTLALILSCGSGTQIERFHIPGSKLVVKIEKTHAHLFLAEYDFRLVLEDSGKQIDSANMTGDSGGLARIDVIRIDDTTLAFRDHARSRCVNVRLRKLQDCEYGFTGSKVGHFDFDQSKRWRFMNDANGS